MKRIVFAFLALLFSTQAYAQSWGPDGEQTPSYPAIPNITELQKVRDRILPVNGDGSNAWGGTPPATSIQPAAIDFPTVLSDGLNSSGGSITGVDEEKFRTVCAGPFYEKKVDPLRGYGTEPFGHSHMFYGNQGITSTSTYTTARTNASPSCPGKGLNNSGYWFPSILKDNVLGTGNTMAKIPNEVLLYYQAHEDMAYENEYTFFLRGMTYIAGMNMDDPGGTNGVPGFVTTELATANASNIYASWQAQDQRATWKCEGGTFTTSRAGLATAAGADLLGNCPAGSLITAAVDGPTCWDGHNLTSPTGYKHVRYALRESAYNATDVCPTGWFKIPAITVKIEFSHQGFADYGTWYCSSDAAAATAAGRAMGHCESLHVDWMGIWDERASDIWQAECIGAKGGTYYGACNDSTVSASGARLNSTGISGTTYNGSLIGHWLTLQTYGSGANASRGRVRMRKGSN